MFELQEIVSLMAEFCDTIFETRFEVSKSITHFLGIITVTAGSKAWSFLVFEESLNLFLIEESLSF